MFNTGTLAGVDMKTLARFTHNLLISVANANQTPRILPCPCSWSAKMKRWALPSVCLTSTVHNFSQFLCEHAYWLQSGEIVLSGSSGEVLNDPRVREAYLGSQ